MNHSILRRALPRLLLLVLIGVLAWYFHRSGLLQKTLDWIDSFGRVGPVMFVAVYALTCVFFVPSFVFTFSGGVLFGFWKGILLSLAGTGLGSLTAFFIGRYLARDLIAQRFAGNQVFSKLAEAAQKKGWKIVALARLTPIFPFAIGNYAFGITNIPAPHYLGASLLGTLPSTTLYTYLGTLLGSLRALGAPGRTRTWQEWAFLTLGLIATVSLSYYLGRFAQKSIKK
ncbi:MAG: TVP38/TMEM64 family protein [Candidatus Omnitrophica bacterium]|nr:TVP38/TMEM64 family protein [Candidatus Omnitrophota bacterium]